MWIFITYFSFLPHYNVFWKHGLPRNSGIWLLFRGPEHSNWIHYSGFWSLGAIHWLEERDWRLLKGLLGQVGVSVWTKPWTTISVGPSDTSIRSGGVPQESSNLNSMIPVSWGRNRESKKWKKKKLIHSLNQSLPYHHLKCAKHSTRPWGVKKEMGGGGSQQQRGKWKHIDNNCLMCSWEECGEWMTCCFSTPLCSKPLPHNTAVQHIHT